MDERERDAVDEALTFLEERDYPLAASLLRGLMRREAPSFQPDWASPPGHTIRMMLKDRGLDADALALQYEPFDLLLEGRLTIDDDLAEKLGETLGPNKEFWLRREAQFRATKTRLWAAKEAGDWQAKYRELDRMVNNYLKRLHAAEKALKDAGLPIPKP